MFQNFSQSLTSIKDLIDILQQASYELTGNQDEARSQLGEVVGELQKFYATLNKEICDFLAISFVRGGNYTGDRQKIMQFKYGDLPIRIENARGHCTKIKHIYKEHLDRWFNQVFRKDNEKLKKINEIFDNLTVYDHNMIDATREVSEYLAAKASLILDYIKTDAFTSADNIVWEVENELGSQIKDINGYLYQMTRLKNDFSHATQIR